MTTKRRVLVFDTYVDPNQTSLNFSLDFREWLAGSMEIARSIPQPFYFSDLRGMTRGAAANEIANEVVRFASGNGKSGECRFSHGPYDGQPQPRCERCE